MFKPQKYPNISVSWKMWMIASLPIIPLALIHSPPLRCCCLVTRSCPALCESSSLWVQGLPACQASLSFTISLHLLKLMSIESVISSNHLHLCHLHPFSSCLQSFPTSESFPVSQLFTYSGQSFGASASASVLSVFIHGWFPLVLTGLISLQSKGLSRVFSNTTIWKHQFFSAQPSLWSSSHIHIWLLEKTYLWLYRPLLAKWCLCFFF